MPITAYVLVRVTPGTIWKVVDEIRKIKGVKSAEAITGDYDIIAYLQGNDAGEIGWTVTEGIQKVAGVLGTRTYVVLPHPSL